MKQITNKIVWLVAFLAIGSIDVFGKPFAVGPYLGQTPPGPIAKVFAPGLICNTGKYPWEANGTFSADGNTFCFNRRSGIFITENTDQGWTTPELISIPANKYSPWLGGLSPDANSIFFTRALVKPVSKRNIYRCIRTPSGWAEPQQLGPPLSSPSPELTCSIAANNNIYIHRGAPEGGMFYAPYENDTWPRAIKLPLGGCDPGPAPDESFIVTAWKEKDMPGGYGHFDLYLTLRLTDGTWSKPRNLGPKINSAYIEYGPRISPDKKYLFFNRCNGWDPRIYYSYIYWVELKEYLPESYR